MSSENNQDDLNEVEAVMAFDPFEDGPAEADSAKVEDAPEGEAVAAETSDGASEEADGGAQPQPDATSSQPETPEPAKAVDPEVSALRAKLAAAQAQLAQKAQPTQPEPGADRSSEPALPDYDFQLPVQLRQMLESEDPRDRAQGYQVMMKGTAQAVHSSMRQEFNKWTQEVFPQAVNSMMHVQAQQRAVFDDFYGTHKDLNHPELYELVKGTAARVMQQTGSQNWSPEVRDAIAAAVRQVLGRGAQPAATQSAPAALPQVPRAAPGAGPKGVEEDIAETFF